MKKLLFEPSGVSHDVMTGSRVLDALLARKVNVRMACGGKGRCATCHVFVTKGEKQLTPPTDREKQTLSIISGLRQGSRLACQCHVLGEGVVVELPEGVYIEKSTDLLSLIGTRAAQNILHPVDGAVLIEQGKLITRSRIEELKRVDAEIQNIAATPNTL